MVHTITLIGKVHSELKKTEDCPLQEHENAPEAVVEIFTEFKDGIEDIKSDDKVILFTWLHQADRKIMKTRPRNNPNAPLTGIFSTRSPDRPNPIGIHFAKVVSVLPNNKLLVSGLEVIDQTPIIDIKPDLGR